MVVVMKNFIINKGKVKGRTTYIQSCGVILYVVLTGYLPFDDRNLAVLYQKIFKGDVKIPKWLSQCAQNMIKRILDPNPQTRITVAKIKEHDWFKPDYTPVNPKDEDVGIYIDDKAFSIQGKEPISFLKPTDTEKQPGMKRFFYASTIIGVEQAIVNFGLAMGVTLANGSKGRYILDHCANKVAKDIMNNGDSTTLTMLGLRTRDYKHENYRVVQVASSIANCNPGQLGRVSYYVSR
ncbi:hypothetical protein IFM89_029345 [Coptis chinensis]|uniref:Protein kinase domain-containing protein n=1 Tax=Coptis chinensis TaxID=261450 RepID=A0A835MFP1_9MAGN|nr:hypothetical protein IFM89_029345 [Coptis chinensis]